MNRLKLWGTLLLSLFILAGCKTQAAEPILPGMVAQPYTRNAYPMGTYVELRVWDEGKDDVLDLALDRIFELEALLSVNEEDGTELSEVEEVNLNAGIAPVSVSSDTFRLIQEAVNLSKAWDGTFNAVIGPLTKLWSIGFPEARRPADSEIEAVLPLLDYNRVVLDEANHTVFLEEPGMRFDLGAIAKGFIADEVAKIFREHGVTSAIIDLGGNIIAMGGNARGADWRIGVQDPFDVRGNSVVTFLTRDKSIVTSGVYERFLEVDGQKYHHILNGKTGFPFETDVAGVTIISDSSMDGDKYSTLAFGLGIEDGLAAIEAMDGVEAIYINFEREIFMTSGLKDQLRLEKNTFTLVE